MQMVKGPESTKIHHAPNLKISEIAITKIAGMTAKPAPKKNMKPKVLSGSTPEYSSTEMSHAVIVVDPTRPAIMHAKTIFAARLTAAANPGLRPCA